MPMVGFPLLLIPLAIYNIIVFLMPDVSITAPLVKLVLMSGAEWTVTLSDVLLTLAILLLLAEVIKGARPGAKYLTDHLLSLILFGAAAAEFVLWQKFATSTFFLLTTLALVDFLSGIALRTRRRAVATVAPARKSVAKAEAPVPEPAPAPAPPPPAAAPVARSTPAAASVAESVLRDHPEPKPEPRLEPKPEPRLDHPEPRKPDSEPELTHPAAPDPASPELPLPGVPSPVVPSPELQPNSGSAPSPDKPDTPKH